MAAEAVAVAVAVFESAAAAAFLGVLVAVADAAVQKHEQKLVYDIFFLCSLFRKKRV